MSPAVKFTIGLAAALLTSWIAHGPLGRGEAFVDSLDAQAKAAIARSGLTTVQVRFDRDPLSRRAILTGQADQFQREGQGQFPGINERVAAVPGVSGIVWDDNDCCAPREGAGNAAAR